jgi:formylglycine-generating enzyme required for sulfatase activity
LIDAITAPSRLPLAPATGMDRDGYPATSMTQLGAKLYCRWLSAKTGRYYRLPTEAEWEYACRAGTNTAYSFGDDPAKLDRYAWYFEDSDERCHRVGKKKPNPWGFHDMHGNVAEWVLDQYRPDFYRPCADGATRRGPFAVPKTTYPRVVRGGSWDHFPEDLRSAARRFSREQWSKNDPRRPKNPLWHTDATFVGFRVVRPLRLPSPEECGQLERIEQDYRLMGDFERIREMFLQWSERLQRRQADGGP